LTGYAGGSPQILYGPYIDYIAVAYGAVAILAALDYRKRTGKGNYIDTAQYETGLQYLAPILLDYKINGRVAERNANRDPHAAPHGAYPCKGDDRWCAIGVSSEEEWNALVKAMKNPAWAKKFTTFDERKANEDELDRLIGEWTAHFEPHELMETLQKAGVKAGVVNRMCDVYEDAQLKQRPQWIEIEHPEIGKMHYQRPPFLLTKTPPGPEKRDPPRAARHERGRIQEARRRAGHLLTFHRSFRRAARATRAPSAAWPLLHLLSAGRKTLSASGSRTQAFLSSLGLHHGLGRQRLRFYYLQTQRRAVVVDHAFDRQRSSGKLVSARQQESIGAGKKKTLAGFVLNAPVGDDA
jgi:hypothetical protein